jgi:predicted membrane channel-forming protein YqfA (hemolysin III family)
MAFVNMRSKFLQWIFAAAAVLSLFGLATKLVDFAHPTPELLPRHLWRALSLDFVALILTLVYLWQCNPRPRLRAFLPLLILAISGYLVAAQ